VIVDHPTFNAKLNYLHFQINKRRELQEDQKKLKFLLHILPRRLGSENLLSKCIKQE
jgi:hypothetical protein